jgi:hypothetical protein
MFLGDWEEADEASNREDESGGKDKGENGWKYDELEVAGHSVIVQYVDEDNETIRFEFGERIWAPTNGRTSALPPHFVHSSVPGSTAFGVSSNPNSTSKCKMMVSSDLYH